MAVRITFAFLALLAIATTSANAQEAVIYVNPANQTHQSLERSPQDELLSELHAAKGDALLLYTDFASRAGNDLKTFLTNMTGFADSTIRSLGMDPTDNGSEECWVTFKYHLKKIEHDARRAATYSGDAHHKFLLGHMIVFRMHINKSQDYLDRCEKFIRGCGFSCESTPRVKRWRRLALEEIHRIRDDIQHSRKSYRDIVSHARRKLNHLRKQALSKSRDAIQEFQTCLLEPRFR